MERSSRAGGHGSVFALTLGQSGRLAHSYMEPGLCCRLYVFVYWDKNEVEINNVPLSHDP
jgi:hypothetical protein